MRNQAKFDGNYTSDEEGEAALQEDLAKWPARHCVKAPPAQPMIKDGHAEVSASKDAQKVVIAVAATVLVNPDLAE